MSMIVISSYLYNLHISTRETINLVISNSIAIIYRYYNLLGLFVFFLHNDN